MSRSFRLLGTTFDSLRVRAPVVGFVSERFGARAGLALGGVAILLALVAFGLWSGLTEWRRRRTGRLREESKDRAGMAGPVLRG